jgi:hypothetical protein
LNNDVDRIITLTTKFDLIKDLTFRSWHYATFFVRIFKEASLNELYVDSECIMFLIDRIYLMKILSYIKIHHVNDLIKIRDIDINVHDCFEYIMLKTNSKKSRNSHVKRTSWIIYERNVSWVWIFWNLKKWFFNIFRQKMILFLCENLKINLRITSKLDSKMNRIILSKRLVTISSRTIASMLIKMKNKIVLNRDYFFQSIFRHLNLESVDDVMTHMMNVNLAAVQICNSTDKSIVISRKARLNRIIEYEEHDCYATDLTKASLAIESFWNKIFALSEIQIDLKNVYIDMKEKFSNEIIVYEIFNIR